MKKIKILSIGLLFFIVFLIWLTVFQLNQNYILKITFFDIGQGDSIFVETPLGGQILFDGGPNNSVLEKLSREMPFYDKTIDFVFISHPDQDHIAGLIPVFDKYKILNVVLSGVKSNTAVYQTLLQKIITEKSKVIIAKRGFVFKFNSGVKIETLFPDRDASLFETNTGSLVNKVVFGKTSILLMGDSPQAIEKYLIELNPQDLKNDILKIGHHGSKTSSNEKFLQTVSPKIIAISVGKNNKYKHPSQKILNLLQKLNLKFLRTDISGNLQFYSNGQKIWQND